MEERRESRARSSKSPSRVVDDAPLPKSMEAISRGLSDSRQFADVMAAIILDVISGSITPGVANAAVNAGGKLLKVKELELRFGIAEGGILILATPAENKS